MKRNCHKHLRTALLSCLYTVVIFISVIKEACAISVRIHPYCVELHYVFKLFVQSIQMYFTYFFSVSNKCARYFH